MEQQLEFNKKVFTNKKKKDIKNKKNGEGENNYA